MMRRRRILVASSLLLLLVLFLWPSNAYAGESFDTLRTKGWLWAYLGVFAAGVLTSLTPCVYPMIPIVVGVFGARDEAVSRVKALLLAFCYVAGMGLMYSGLGVVVALTGQKFGALLANPWVVFPLVGFYALLAASMFGAFELNLPSSWQQRLNQVGGRGYAGALGMGLVGGLTAAPCTGPILAGLLAFVATTGNVPLGFSLLLVYALGMGVLFLVIATFALSLPKSGRWMEWVKSIAAIALLDVGVYFMRPVVPALRRATDSSAGFLAAAIVTTGIGLLIGAVHLSFHDRWRVRIRKGVGVALTVVGIAGTVNWILTPKHPLPWRHDEAGALAEAKSANKGVLVDISAEWCVPCKRVETQIFSDPVVHEDVESRYIPLRFDVTEQTDHDIAMQSKYHADTLPSVTLLDRQGNIALQLDSVQLEHMSADQFAGKLRDAVSAD